MSEKWYLSYNTIKHSKDGKIYLPVSPSKYLSKPKVSSVIVVKMSCGGGMGGSCWNEYLLDKDIKDNMEILNQLKKNDNNISGKEAEIREMILEAVGATAKEIPFVGELIRVKDDERKWENSIENKET